jgi:hypothetical protein
VQARLSGLLMDKQVQVILESSRIASNSQGTGPWLSLVLQSLLIIGLPDEATLPQEIPARR